MGFIGPTPGDFEYLYTVVRIAKRLLKIHVRSHSARLTFLDLYDSFILIKYYKETFKFPLLKKHTEYIIYLLISKKLPRGAFWVAVLKTIFVFVFFDSNLKIVFLI